MAMNRARVVKSPWGSIRRAMTSQGVHPPKNPVRLVLFDVFGERITYNQANDQILYVHPDFLFINSELSILVKPSASLFYEIL